MGGPQLTLYRPEGHLRSMEELEADIIRLAIGHCRMTEVARRPGSAARPSIASSASFESTPPPEQATLGAMRARFPLLLLLGQFAGASRTPAPSPRHPNQRAQPADVRRQPRPRSAIPATAASSRRSGPRRAGSAPVRPISAFYPAPPGRLRHECRHVWRGRTADRITHRRVGRQVRAINRRQGGGNFST